MAAKIARIMFGILQNPAPFSPGLARPNGGGKAGTTGNFYAADRKILRKAKRCLARASEILDDRVIATDIQRLSAALDTALHQKSEAVRGEPSL